MRASIAFAVACLALVICATTIAGQDVDGGWSAWSPCTKVCDSGTADRTCTNPAPSGAGAPCPGLNYQVCSPTPCVNCTVYGMYSGGASGCSKLCGGGTYWVARAVAQYPGPGGTPCPQLNFTYPCNTAMCYNTISGYGFWFWGPFKGPGPLSYVITRIDTEIDVYLFDQENFVQYQYDVQRVKPYQTNYSPLRADLNIDTVKAEGPITLDSTTNYYLVVDHTKIGAAAGSTDNNGNQVFLPNRFYYRIDGVDYGTGFQSEALMSGAVSMASVSSVAIVLSALVALLL